MGIEENKEVTIPILEVKEDSCTKCGICVYVCPKGIIGFEDDAFPIPLPVAEQTCDRCGACLISCPSDSFIHRDIPSEDCWPIETSLEISFDQCAQLIKTRRSIRVFNDKSVAREDINKILEVVRYSPTGNNMQNVKWMVFDDKDEVDHFRKVGNEWLLEVFKTIPAYTPLVEVKRRQNEAGKDPFLRGAPVILATYGPTGQHVTATIAMAYVDLVANSIGLGACWCGFFAGAANNFAPIKETIGLPEGQEIFGGMILGYPKYRYHKIPKRNPANITWR